MSKENNLENENKQCTLYFIGRTFFALYESERGTRHDRMVFVKDGLDEKGFFDWVQSERVKIEKDGKTNCCVMDCKIV